MYMGGRLEGIEDEVERRLDELGDIELKLEIIEDEDPDDWPLKGT